MVEWALNCGNNYILKSQITSVTCPDLLVDATITMWGSIFDDFLFPSIRVRSWPTMRDSCSLLWKCIKILFSTHSHKRRRNEWERARERDVNLLIIAAWTYGIKFIDEYHSWFTTRSLRVCFRKSFTQELFSLSHMGFVYRIWTAKMATTKISGHV